MELEEKKRRVVGQNAKEVEEEAQIFWDKEPMKVFLQRSDIT